MDAAAVTRRFGLDEAVRVWLEEAADLPLPDGGVPLAPPERAREAVAPLGLAPRDADELVAVWPDAGWPVELLWVVERMYARLADDLARGGREWRDWPVLVGAGDVRVRCTVLVALAAAVPLLRAHHAAHGVEEEVSAATLADTGRHVAQTRTMYGLLGLETSTWMALHFRGGLYELGRLQYEPNRAGAEGPVAWYPREEAAERGPEWAWGAPVLRLHIPVQGPLDPGRVGESLGRARGFFAERFGVDYPLATCSSWLLDPQLAEYLPESSNIVAFQRRFTLVEEDREVVGDSDVFRFVFWRPGVEVDAVPQRTRLERAVVAHLRSGRHWRVRTGWLRLG
ncbi:acyltransferase domain-containing protein [Streptomonospora nanhaiensis]|uniref:Acyltransferase n=1 Tax=Streptomonospora nanhaiensis TaxID=1323731 RepID=A0A853BGH7_9ACTN|nr:acyltransferase domain-containing protein [Streptomonospora nanhaiensis]MBV2366295.1 DUF5596 domain-containing protein [Streptomonospora nanhaiensis]MBX9387910.1 acyltransferase domain-containing protein [Streptomonospora nanhaiensis]NYI94423.1 hypothetical protein [Streptomonospora nanhaiensis]